jgi:uncharacterized low-complexity protein
MKMKNNDWNVPSDYFEKNKKALMPVRKMSNRNWLLALAAACFVGIGLFIWKSEDQNQEIAKVENQNENEGKIGEDVGAKNLSPKGREEKMGEDKRGEEKVREGKRGEEKVREGKNREEMVQEITKELKEIPREELVAYLLEEDSELIENLN